jgi:catechol 2,3-dioxygenase-like lactoylglutathione lyase family enzyme
VEQRVSLVTLGVADLDRARRFYEAGLGWTRGNTDDGVAFYQLPGMILALWSRESLAEDAGVVDKGGIGGIALAYNARSEADVDAVLAEARAAGATILKAAAKTFWGGYSGYFADPDGHPWEVAWNPHWSFGEDGSVRLTSSK